VTKKRCPRCGKTKPLDKFYRRSVNKKHGRSCYCKPCVADAKNEWIAAHPERYRELNLARNGYKREWDHANRASCPQCGQSMGMGSGSASKRSLLCRDCFDANERDRIDERGHQIEAWWAEGLSQNQIAEALGWTRGHVQVELVHLRERGFNLPYRRQPSRPKHPELRKAA